MKPAAEPSQGNLPGTAPGKPVVLTTSPGFGKAGDLPARIAASDWTLLRETEPDRIMAALPGATLLVAGLPAVTAQTLAAGPGLRGVLKHGTGTDNIDIAACTAAGLPVTNAPAANAEAVAELAVGLMFALARHIPQGHVSVTGGGWQRRFRIDLAGRTLGIAGFGNIGRALARRARALGLTVLAADPYADRAQAQALGVTLLPLAEMLPRCDVLSLHVAGGAGVAGLIGAAEVAALRPGALVLNLSRGQVAPLDPLLAGLVSGQLGGVAIDAYDTEPPDISHPIFAHPNAIFTPHSGADTVESLVRMGHMVIDDIETLLRGGRPARTLNPAAHDLAPAPDTSA